MTVLADVFAPLPRSRAEDIATMAAEIGRQTADLGALAFEQPIPASLRQLFEREMLEEIGAMLDESDKLTPADRAHFQAVAALALDRRFAYHATRDAVGNA